RGLVHIGGGAMRADHMAVSGGRRLLGAFGFQHRAPRPGEPEDPAFVGFLVRCQDNAAVTIARARAGECDPKQKCIRSLSRSLLA
ncbi:MAG TPA: hypothetical protein PLD46_08175, partial [Hyphomicrobium sp.]|nr:hypothetical protein [Hyphomicrobium sp.]